MNYRREIDGLRAVAVVPVVLFHAGWNVFSGGYVGVDVFFVISGYLITSIILEERAEGKFSIIRFYERRVRRIFPALFFVFAITIPLAWAFMLPLPFQDFMRSLAAASLFISNVHFWETTGYFSEAAELRPLLHTWSLAVEEQYYLIFPILTMALGAVTFRKYIICFVAIAIFSILLSEWGWRNHPDANFFFTFSRFWELFIGSICAVIAFKRKINGNQWLSMIGLAMILVSIFCFDMSIPSPSVYILVPVVGAALVILYAREGTLVARTLSLRSLVGLGLISYSTYLWHQPIFSFARIVSSHAPSPTMMIFGTISSFALAAITWRYVEQPFRSHKGQLLPKRAALFGVGLMSIAVFVSLGLAGQKGGPFKPLAAQGVPESLLNAEFDFGDNYYTCLPLGSEFNLDRAIQECSTTTSANRKVLLLGDSHAAQYAAALRHGAETIGYDFQQLTANSCTPFADFSLYEVNCESYVESVTEFLAQAQPDLVVLSQRWTKAFENSGFDNGEGGIELGSVDAVRVGQLEPGTEGYQNFLADRLKHSLERLLEETTVVLIGPSPEAGWNVPQKLQKSVFSRETSYENLELSTSFNRFLERNGAVLERLSKLKHPDLFYYKPHEALCDRQIKGRCVNFWQGKVLYYDDDHLSQTGSMFIAPELLKVVQMALGD